MNSHIKQDQKRQAKQRRAKQRQMKQRQTGFTLMEVMVAMIILMIALSALAAIFPATAMLQKRASDVVNGNRVNWSGQAVVRGAPYSEAVLTGGGAGGLPAGFDTSERVYPLPGIGWTLSDRSDPYYEPDPSKRRYYWIPLIQDADSDPGSYDWRSFIFVVNRHGDDAGYTKSALGSGMAWANASDPAEVPGVRSVRIDQNPGDASRLDFNTGTPNFNDVDGDGVYEHIQIGDSIVDEHGFIYKVKEAKADYIKIVGFVSPTFSGDYPEFVWYAKPMEEGRKSPAVRVDTFSGGAE